MGRSKKIVETARTPKRKRDPIKILVVGDFMQDIYWFGHAEGLSAEAPIPKITITHKEIKEGGAGNVLANLLSLGALAKGPDCGYWLEVDHLGSPIDLYPNKHRLMIEDQQIARWDQFDTCWEIDKKYLPTEIDRIVIADYNKGSIGPELLSYLYELNLPTFVDTKQDPTIYVGWITAIFPNLSEYERYHDTYDKFERCIVTLGAGGAEIREFGKIIEQQPAYASQVVSVCGAGDTFTAAYALRWPRHDALQFASLGAAVAVGKPLTSTITIQEITDLRRRLK